MHGSFYKRESCRLCNSQNLEKVLELKPTPLCDAYIAADRDSEDQALYPLDLFLCHNCGYVHLPYVVNPEIIYRDYIYVTTSSLGLADHFENYVNRIMHYLKPSKGSLVMDIGSNDGTLLRFFKARGMRVLGIEPATEVAKKANEIGIETLPDFFTPDLSVKVKNNYGQAAIITMNNLFANIDDLMEITSGIKNLLAPEGFFIIETAYLSDIIQNMVFDFIYHEHLSYFSVKPLRAFFERLGMRLVNVERISTKGGSLRLYVQLKSGSAPTVSIIDELVRYEESIGLDQSAIYETFSQRINERKHNLMNKLCELKASGKVIAGYGASATTTTLLYHFEIGNMINYIVDDNPAKQNTFSPGLHILILPSDILYSKKPDYVVIFAWRYFEPIVRKHIVYLNSGGRFIRPLPEFEIVKNTYE